MTDLITTVNRALTAKEFQGALQMFHLKLNGLPTDNVETRRAYENVKDFMNFTGIQVPEEFRIVTRAHIAWRDDLLSRTLSSMSIRHLWRQYLLYLSTCVRKCGT